MRLSLVSLLLLALVASASAKTLFTRTAAPGDWVRQRRADKDAKVTVSIQLTNQNLELLNDAFHAVSDPASPYYRQFLTADEVETMIRPKAVHKARVVEWLVAAGVESPRDIVDLSDVLVVQASVDTLEQLFSTEMHLFSHKLNPGRHVVRAFGESSVPAGVEEAVQFVEGLNNFPSTRRAVRKPAAGGSDAVVPQTLAGQYDFTLGSGDGTGASAGVGEFGQGQSFSPSDLVAYYKAVGVNGQAIKHIVGTNVPSEAGTEASLDVDMVGSVAAGAEQWFVIADQGQWLLAWSATVLSQPQMADVLSLSYGWSLTDQCQQGIGSQGCGQNGVDSQGYVALVNAKFQAIGVRGTSLFASSGDSGAPGRTDESCLSGKANPTFPAASPYVTAVGATQILSEAPLSNGPPVCNSGFFTCNGGGNESAVSYAISQFASGGGFSVYDAMPSYQTSHVQKYLNSGVYFPKASAFNSSGRAYPDVAACGHNLLIEQDGSNSLVGGTSASSPIWAGVAARMTAAARAKDGKPLGFMNPLLYKIAENTPEAFNDVTVGSNCFCESGSHGSGTSAGCKASSCPGFEATNGWDAVTGLGTPSVQNLISAAVDML